MGGEVTWALRLRRSVFSRFTSNSLSHVYFVVSGYLLHLELEVFLALTNCKQGGPENAENVTKGFSLYLQLLVRQGFGSDLLRTVQSCYGNCSLAYFFLLPPSHRFESEQTNICPAVFHMIILDSGSGWSNSHILPFPPFTSSLIRT